MKTITGGEVSCVEVLKSDNDQIQCPDSKNVQEQEEQVHELLGNVSKFNSSSPIGTCHQSSSESMAQDVTMASETSCGTSPAGENIDVSKCGSNVLDTSRPTSSGQAINSGLNEQSLISTQVLMDRKKEEKEEEEREKEEEEVHHQVTKEQQSIHEVNLRNQSIKNSSNHDIDANGNPWQQERRRSVTMVNGQDHGQSMNQNLELSNCGTEHIPEHFDTLSILASLPKESPEVIVSENEPSIPPPMAFSNETSNIVLKQVRSDGQVREDVQVRDDDVVLEPEVSNSNCDLKLSSSSDSTMIKGLMWQLKDGGSLFSGWKERYFILTKDYLTCFKKSSKRSLILLSSSSSSLFKSEMGSFSYKLKLLDIESIEWKSSSDCSSRSLRRKNKVKKSIPKLKVASESNCGLNGNKTHFSSSSSSDRRSTSSSFLINMKKSISTNNSTCKILSIYNSSNLEEANLEETNLEDPRNHNNGNSSPTSSSGSNSSHKEVIQININKSAFQASSSNGSKNCSGHKSTIDLWSPSRSLLNEWMYTLKEAINLSKNRREQLIKKSVTAFNLPSSNQAGSNSPFALSSSSYWLMTRDDKSKHKQQQSSLAEGRNSGQDFLTNRFSNTDGINDGQFHNHSSDLSSLPAFEATLGQHQLPAKPNGGNSLRSSHSYSNGSGSEQAPQVTQRHSSITSSASSNLSTSVTFDATRMNRHSTPLSSTPLPGFRDQQPPPNPRSSSLMDSSAINHQAFATSSRVLGLQSRSRARNQLEDLIDPSFISSLDNNSPGIISRPSSSSSRIGAGIAATEGRRRTKAKTILDPRFEEPVQLEPEPLARLSSSNGINNGGISSLVSLDRRLVNHRNSTGSSNLSSSSSSNGLERRTLIRNATAVAAANGQVPFFGTSSTLGHNGHGQHSGHAFNLHQASCPKSLLVSPAMGQRSLYAQQLIDQQQQNQIHQQSNSGNVFCTTSRGWTKDDLLRFKNSNNSIFGSKGSNSKNSSSQLKSATSEFSFVLPPDSPLTLPYNNKSKSFYNRPLPPTPGPPPRPPLPRESSLQRNPSLTRISSSASLLLPKQSSLDESGHHGHHHHGQESSSSRTQVRASNSSSNQSSNSRLLFMLQQKDSQPVHFGSCSNVRPSSYHHSSSSYHQSSSIDGDNDQRDYNQCDDEDDDGGFGDKNFDELIRKLKLSQQKKSHPHSVHYFQASSSNSTSNTPLHRSSSSANYYNPTHSSSSRTVQSSTSSSDHQWSHIQAAERRQKSLDPDYDAFESASSPNRGPRTNRMNRILKQTTVQYSN